MASVGERILDKDLVKFALLGFTKLWQTFMDGICVREKLSDWERLWGDCVEENIHKQAGSHVKIEEDEENFALASKGGKSKGKKSSGGGELSSKGEKKKKDLNKIKCFSCHYFVHFVTKCPNQKKGSRNVQVVAYAKIDE